MSRGALFFILLIIAIFNLCIFQNSALSFSSPDIPIHHWSYESIEKLAMGGLVGLSGIDAKPMTRVQMAYTIKEAMDNIEEEKLPPHLSFDREYVEYLQNILYKLIDEFREELVLIGASAARVESEEDESPLKKYLNTHIGFPIETEQRFVSVKSRGDLLLENENGLRLDKGYNLRTRVYPWVNMFNLFTFSARPALRLSETGTEVFLDEAAAKFTLWNLELSAGKSAMWWGPGYHGAMLISNNAEPLTLARARTVNHFRLPWVLKHIGSFGVNFFISKLEKDRVYPEPRLAGLRLEYSPLPCLSLAANRTDISGGRGRPKTRARDYWKIFYGAGRDEFSTGQEIKRTDTDQLASFDLRFAAPLPQAVPIASGLEIYGEWAGEDRFSFWENESPGFLAGVFLTDIFKNKGTDIRVEYAKDKPAWYIHGIYNIDGSNLAYAYKDEIIGHHMGGDADDLFFRVSKEMPFLSTPYFDAVKAGVQVDRERHGLSLGVQERMLEIAGDILWTHKGQLAFSFGYEFEQYKNFAYVAGSGTRNHIVTAMIHVTF